MSKFHRTPRRHSTKAHDHGSLVVVLALAIGAAAFVPAFTYLGAQDAWESGVTVEEFVPLVGPTDTRPPPPPIDEAGGQAVNILLMGSDTRAGGNAAIGGAENSLNNDTTIIMHISADRTRIELLSIPRDSLVRIPGCFYSDGTRTYPETTKFNKAFYIGGLHGSIGEAAACVIRTVESTTGIPIQDYIVIDFMGVVNVINQLGGVPMCIPFDVKSPEAQLDLKAGPQTLTGWQAISWARARKFVFESASDRRAFEAYYSSFYDDGMGFNGADFGRIRRQQELIGKVFEVILEEGTLYHPTELIAFLQSVAESMTVSPNIQDFDFVRGLAWSLRHVDKSHIVFREVPSKMHSDGINAVWLPEAYDIFEQIINDEPISGKSVADLSDAAPSPDPGASPSPGSGQDGETDNLEDRLLGACEVG